VFWKRWFNKKTHAVPDRTPKARASAVAVFPDDETAATEPVMEASSEFRPAKVRRDDTWFSKAELAAIKNVRDEKQVAQVISRKVPGAGREEVLFRYYLSRAVFVGDFDLPMLPDSSTQILQLSRDTNSEIEDYVKIISADPSLLQAIVNVANSPFFASLSGSASLDQAIVRIGLRQVEQITMLHAMRSRVFRVSGFESLIRSLVNHGLRVAIAGQVVAQKSMALPADAFLAGMFHDVGKLVLTKIIGDVQHKLSWQAPAALVASCFETYHVSFGEIVCHHWKFPDQIAEAVGNHHDARHAAEQPLDRTIYIANLLAHSLADPDLAGALVTDPVVTTAGLDARDLDSCRSDLEKELQAYEVLSPS